MSYKKYTITLRIEGTRIKGFSDELRTEDVFYFGELDNLPTTNSEDGTSRNVTYFNYLDEIPATISADIDLFTSAYNISAPTFALVATDTITQFFFQMSQRAKTGLLNEAMSSGTTTAKVRYAGTIEAGDSLYIADECLYVNSVTSYTGGVYTLSVIRRQGWLGKNVAYLAEAKVYVNYVPYFNFRRCKLEIFDNDLGTSVYTYVGIIDDVSTNDDTTQIIIKTKDLISTLINVELPSNIDAFNVNYNTSRGVGNSRQLGLISPESNDNFNNYQFAVERKLSGVGTYDIGSPYKSWKIDETVYRTSGSYDASSGGYNTAKQFFNNNLPVFYKSLLDEDIKDLANNNEPVTETLSFTIDTPFAQMPWDIRVDETATSYDKSYTADDYIGRNPVVICLILMMSSGTGDNRFQYGDYDFQPDVLNKAWGAGIPIDYLEASTFADMITQTKSYQIDNFNFGYDGTQNIKDVIKDLLRLVNAFFYINENGKIAVSRYESFNFADVEASLNLTESVQNLVYLEAPKCKIVREYEYQNVIGEVGGMPGQNKTRISINELTGDRRDSNLNNKSFTINYEYLDKDKALRGTRSFSDIELTLRNFKTEFTNSSPYLDCTVPISYATNTGIPGLTNEVGKVPSLSSWVIIRGSNEIIGPDGSRIVINDEDNWVIFLGRIVGYTFNVSNMTYNLKVYLQNWTTGTLPKLVAPSARIDSYNSGTKTLTVDLSTNYNTLANTVGFKVGDEVTIVDEYGRASYLLYTGSGYDSISSISTNNIVLTNGLTAALPTDMVYYLRIAKYDEYDNTSAVSYLQYFPASQRRLWAFLADSSNVLGASNDDPDVWGF